MHGIKLTPCSLLMTLGTKMSSKCLNIADVSSLCFEIIQKGGNDYELQTKE